MSTITRVAPAKLNLFLAITGRREDGFHELVSVVAPLKFGDTLRVEPATEFSLGCDVPDVPVDGTNLVLRAAQAFAAASGWRGGARFFIEKRIPMGAGLGGGSSNAVAALRALNVLAGPAQGLAPEALARVAAQLGSDCPLFLHDGPVVMRGRGVHTAARCGRGLEGGQWKSIHRWPQLPNDPSDNERPSAQASRRPARTGSGRTPVRGPGPNSGGSGVRTRFQKLADSPFIGKPHI